MKNISWYSGKVIPIDFSIFRDVISKFIVVASVAQPLFEGFAA